MTASPLDLAALRALADPSVIESHCVGSRWSVVPPVMDRDDDRLVLVSDFDAFYEVAMEDGFAEGGSGGSAEDTLFVSLKRDADRVNLIVTENAMFATRFVAADGIVRRLNLTRKSDRISVFRAVLYGEAPSGLPRLATPVKDALPALLDEVERLRGLCAKSANRLTYISRDLASYTGSNWPETDAHIAALRRAAEGGAG